MKKTLMSIVLGAAAMVLMVGGVKADIDNTKYAPLDNTNGITKNEKGQDVAINFSTNNPGDEDAEQQFSKSGIKDLVIIPDSKTVFKMVKKDDKEYAIINVGLRTGKNTQRLSDSNGKRPETYVISDDAINPTYPQALGTDEKHLTLEFHFGLDDIKAAAAAGTTLVRKATVTWNPGRTENKSEFSQTVSITIDPKMVNLKSAEDEELVWNNQIYIDYLYELLAAQNTANDNQTTAPSETNPAEETPTAPTSNAGNTTDVKNPNTSDNFMSLVSMVSASAAGLFIAFKKIVLS